MHEGAPASSFPAAYGGPPANSCRVPPPGAAGAPAKSRWQSRPAGVLAAQFKDARSLTYPESAEDFDRKLSLLLVEDDPADVELLARALQRDGFEVSKEVVQTPEQFVASIHRTRFDIVLADYRLPSWSGMEALDLLRHEGVDIPFILVTGALGDVTAVECIKQGATDYVLKDRLARLSSSIRRALREKRLDEELRRDQEQLARKVNELDRSNRELEQFAYVASHDLQEPLRMVAMYTQLLADRYGDKLDEKAQKCIHYAVDGALRMQTLIRDLLEFSRTGRYGPELVPTETERVLENALKNLHAAIAENDAQITWGALPLVKADASQLLQVFQNLIGNAIKFHGKDAPRIHICAEPRGNEWLFSVRDNGIGIDPQHAEEIFIIFKRLHTRAEYAGNGIGLSICKKIVEQHGGRIWVEPHAGPGSTFQFSLPASPVSRAEADYERFDRHPGDQR